MLIISSAQLFLHLFLLFHLFIVHIFLICWHISSSSPRDALLTPLLTHLQQVTTEQKCFQSKLSFLVKMSVRPPKNLPKNASRNFVYSSWYVLSILYFIFYILYFIFFFKCLIFSSSLLNLFYTIHFFNHFCCPFVLYATIVQPVFRLCKYTVIYNNRNISVAKKTSAYYEFFNQILSCLPKITVQC